MICNIYIMQAYEYDRILMRAYGNVLSCALALTSGIVYSISEARDRRGIVVCIAIGSTACNRRSLSFGAI